MIKEIVENGQGMTRNERPETTLEIFLRFFGDTLIPDEVTKILGCSPTDIGTKGDKVTEDGGRTYPRHTGKWILEVPPQSPFNADQQINAVLGKLPSDLEIWRTLRSRFKLELDLLLVLRSGVDRNNDLLISSGTLEALGQREIELDVRFIV
ncbi:MAG: DUF4279 domain-containing protein [Alphaproteobacteria bacterium]|nr:MAG: DUF4279 domain-containing protein [Alphaproteobacteria bacterium]